jgi:hypothetical protein
VQAAACKYCFALYIPGALSIFQAHGCSLIEVSRDTQVIVLMADYNIAPRYM